MKIQALTVFFFIILAGCVSNKNDNTPLIGFLDYVQDPTIEQAHDGFFDALKENGYDTENNTLKVVYANAQGDIPTLNQAADMILAKQPVLVATNVTLPTITMANKTNEVPIFMIVSPRPDIAGLTDASGKNPPNLFGVYETLAYIDTAISIIPEVMPDAKVIGTIYNQAEPQSVDAVHVLQEACNRFGIQLILKPVTNSSESQLVAQSLLNENIDAFFALPDNVIFASFETILNSCDKKGVPVFTSESGLVMRGAVASYGADFYQWGYQCGTQAAKYLNGEKISSPEEVLVRKRTFNSQAATRLGLQFNQNYEPVTALP